MSERYYVNSPLAEGPIVIEGPEARHLAAVCRLRPGDSVSLFNGDGREYAADVTLVGRRQIELTVLRSKEANRELAFALTVACPLPKGDRGQFLIEKLTELGVMAYVPLKTERSVINPGEGKLEKLERYVIEACKQCGRNVLMKIAPVTAWESFVERSGLPSCRWLAHPGGHSVSPISPPVDRVVAVGPEGGFTDGEVKAALSSGWQLIGLGPRILRVETAAIALASVSSLTK